MNEIERAIDHIQRGLSTLGVFKDVVLSALRAELSRQENAPLTWDEVVEMKGKPVYIHVPNYKGWSNYSIVGETDEFGSITLYSKHDNDGGTRASYGTGWIAYRYEPKGEQSCTQD